MSRFRLTLGMLTLAWVFSGCSLEHLNPIPPVGPFFVLETQESQTYERLSLEADQLLSGCAATHSCSRAHYMRGLAALYEDRKTAVEHFQASADLGRSSTVADDSAFWLQLLKQTTPYSGKGPLAQITAQLLRQLLDKELLVRHVMKEAQKEVQPAALTSLKRELQARDRQVEDLTRQLEALKQIDREMRKKTLSSRPSSKSTPSREKENP